MAGKKFVRGFIPSQRKMTIDFIRDAVEADGAKSVISELSNAEVKLLAGFLPEVSGKSIAKLRTGLLAWAE